MLPVIALLFLIVPIVELAIIVQVSGSLGLGSTLLLLIALSVAGAWLVKREGLGVVRRVQHQLSRGQVPGRELVDGFLIVIGGALMLTPGFLTDGVGFSLLLPPVRAALRAWLGRRFRSRVAVYEYRDPGRHPRYDTGLEDGRFDDGDLDSGEWR